MKLEMTLGLVVLTLAFGGCSDAMNSSGSKAGSSQQHTVNRPTDSGSLPSTNPDASGTSVHPDMNGAKPGTAATPDSGLNNGLPTTGSGANGTAPSTYAPGQSGATSPSGADATNAGAKAPTETTTPPNGR
jgi:hypothetical protein